MDKSTLKRIAELSNIQLKEEEIKQSNMPDHNDFVDSVEALNFSDYKHDEETESEEEDRWSYTRDTHYTVTTGYHTNNYDKVTVSGNIIVSEETFFDVGYKAELNEENVKKFLIEQLSEDGNTWLNQILEENDYIPGNTEEIEEIKIIFKEIKKLNGYNWFVKFDIEFNYITTPEYNFPINQKQ